MTSDSTACEWPDDGGGSYPTVAEGERLFDRQRVADVISGDG